MRDYETKRQTVGRWKNRVVDRQCFANAMSFQKSAGTYAHSSVRLSVIGYSWIVIHAKTVQDIEIRFAPYNTRIFHADWLRILACDLAAGFD